MMKIRGIIFCCLREQHGVSALEFGLIFPFIVLAILGSFQVFWLARAQMLTTNAARVIANLVSSQSSVSTADIKDFCIAAQLSMKPMAASGLVASVASVTNSNGTRNIDWTDKSCGTVSTISNAATLAQSVTPNSKDTAIVVLAVFTVTMPFAYPLSSSFTVNSTALAFPRGSTTVTHS